MPKHSDKLTKQTLSLYWGFWRAHIGLVAALLTTVPVASFALRFLPPLIVANILQKMSSGAFIPHNLMASFGHDLILYAIATVAGGIVLWRIAIFLTWQLEMRVIQDIDQTIFDHLIGQSTSFHTNRFSGSLVSQTNKFASAYIRLQDTLIFQVIGTLMSIVFAVGLLLRHAPWIALFLVIYSIIFVFVALAVTRETRRIYAKESSISNKRTGFLADAMTNVMAIKSFSAEAYESKRYAGVTSDVRSVTNELSWDSLRKDTIFSSLTSVLNIIALLIAAISVVTLKANISTVYLVVTYTGIINMNLWDFSQSTMRNINRALGDAKDMTEILNTAPSIRDPEQPEPSRITRGQIVLQNLTFAHHDSKDSQTLFQNLNMTIQPGERIGLVGHSGSGKTTLTKLLLRYYDIDDGAILLDGQNIAHITQSDLRAAIAYVPQEPLLFHRSLAENIHYGRPSATQTEIAKAAKMAHAEEFIASLPDGYNTLVGERGVKLSGGQRQRVAIARAMLKDAPILLLDEATSALDSESEVLIQDALWKLMEGRTALVIAHRLSTIQKMDRIIVMDDGKIVEQGTHKQLLQHSGIYAKLWSHQSGGFIDE
jgi:ATP-binding cassette subfamily B protein